MDYRELVSQLTPELVATFKRSLERGRWPDGRPLTDEQREHTLQAVIAYDQLHKQEDERVGYIDRSRKQGRETKDATTRLTWADGEPGGGEGS